MSDAYAATVKLADSLQTMLRVSRIDAKTIAQFHPKHKAKGGQPMAAAPKAH